MGRKIGEIKQINEEWYQCVEGRCKDCYFSKKRYLCKQFITKNFCTSGIIFKKLEKVGEPFERNGYMYQEYKAHTYPLLMSGDAKIPTNNGFAVIIKQTKEKMEENKLRISFEKADYLINKLQDILADYLHGGESDEVIAKFEELLDIEEKHSNSERIGKDLREFDLKAAKSGKPVYTRDGRKARIICFDRIDSTGLNLPIVALIQCEGTEVLQLYRDDGKRNVKVDLALDLIMLPEKKEGWAKIRKDINLYDTKEEADRKMIGNDEYVTAKVCWEE